MTFPIYESIKENSHWRVLIRPDEYNEENTIPIEGIQKIIETTKVKLRGWDFPHIGNPPNDQSYGQNWFSSQSNFHGHIEYWRFYQSKQFIYLSTIRENVDKEWESKLRERAKTMFFVEDDETIKSISGFISIDNFIYTITEFFTFLNNLCNRGIYNENVSINIELNGIENYTLITEPNKAWWNIYSAKENSLKYSNEYNISDLISNSDQYAMDVVKWFFIRFGWREINIEALISTQENFKKGLL